ncbi:MAG: pentapeptide repeat-containing protein [Anderseniella sp.]|nr:pentapeptide repeat-containing protein [Anderseniella sp.]
MDALELVERYNAGEREFGGPYLVRANLSGSVLREANLSEASLNGPNLSGADLRRAWLDLAHLDGANLAGANPQETFLYGANLSGANLTVANLEGSRLYGADLSGATMPDGTDRSNQFNCWKEHMRD